MLSEKSTSNFISNCLGTTFQKVKTSRRAGITSANTMRKSDTGTCPELILSLLECGWLRFEPRDVVSQSDGRLPQMLSNW